MRYAIMAATVQQVKAVGGIDIKEARSTGIIFATLTKEQVDRLKSLGCQVTPVGQVKADIMPPIVAPPVPVAAVPTYTPEELVLAARFEELRPIMSPPLYGEGFNLAIVDSGIRETHTKINGRVTYRKNYTSDPMRDGLSHGTGVCSIALAVAPLCNILNLKVLNDKGEGTEEDVVMAIDDCISLHEEGSPYAPQVMNLSLGAPDDGNPNNPLRVACRAAIDRGIWIAASSGNGGPSTGTITSPACEKYVLAVGSAKYEPFGVSYFSSRGPTKGGLVKPDGIMFGEDIVVASSESDTATVAKSGTSFATPFLSGYGILYREGEYRQAVATQPIPGVAIEVTWAATVQGIIDRYLPMICVKPEGVVLGKDVDYGYGLPFGPLVAQALGLVPTIDISAMLAPVVGIGILSMLGMMIIPMAKGVR